MNHTPGSFAPVRLWISRLAAVGFAATLMLSACAGDDDDDNGSSSGGDGGGDDGGDDGGGEDGDGGALSPECSALCAHTDTATDEQGDCAAGSLNLLGGYLFQEASCVALAEAFDDGSATVAQCVQCYLDAEVEAGHCEQTEGICFP